MGELLTRLDDFNRRLKSIAESERLSRDGQMAAVALLTTMNAGLFTKLAAALRARSGEHQLPRDSDR